MESDAYLTIEAVSEGVYKEKGSRFIAHAYPVTSPEEIKTLLEKERKEYHDARHHCFAFVLGADRQTWRVNDDGEPSGTAGKPILGKINSYNLTDILIVVTRYFGGKLLGTSGLINAYRTASGLAIENSRIIELTVKEHFEISFPYTVMNDVMKIIKEEEIDQSEQDFKTDCRIVISFRASVKERILARLSRIEGLNYKCHIVT